MYSGAGEHMKKFFEKIVELIFEFIFEEKYDDKLERCVVTGLSEEVQCLIAMVGFVVIMIILVTTK